MPWAFSLPDRGRGESTTDGMMRRRNSSRHPEETAMAGPRRSPTKRAAKPPRAARPVAGPVRLPAEDPDRPRLRRGDRDRRWNRRASLSRAPGQPRSAQARGHAAGVQLQAARRLQQDGAPERRAAGRAASSAPRPATMPRASRWRRERLGCRARDRDAGDDAEAEGRRRARARRRGRAARRQLLRRLPARARAGDASTA